MPVRILSPIRTALLGALTLAAPGIAPAALPLVIHEWGTITTRHDAAGKPASGLNRIAESEVLPSFVHRYEPEATRDNPELFVGKSPFVPGRPDVTMRLETPVLYFYPPNGEKYATPIDITVQFRGGVLNEYYPDAEASVGLDTERVQSKIDAGVRMPWDGKTLSNYVVGTLQWKGLRLHDTVVAPLTNSAIWVAPRAVHSTSVFIPESGEGEQYLFYRGVAHLDALLQTRLTGSGLRLSAPALLTWLETPAVDVPNIWFADIRADDVIAFREHPRVTLSKERAGKELAQLKRFAKSDYTPEGAAQLRRSMKQALIKQGLFADEAEALLNTWKESYFHKPGLRVFYIVPRDWTYYFLPLEVSVPAQLTRVIVGRIDLVE